MPLTCNQFLSCIYSFFFPLFKILWNIPFPPMQLFYFKDVCDDWLICQFTPLYRAQYFIMGLIKLQFILFLTLKLLKSAICPVQYVLLLMIDIDEWFAWYNNSIISFSFFLYFSNYCKRTMRSRPNLRSAAALYVTIIHVYLVYLMMYC